MTATYIYSGPAGTAALHLLDHSALAHCTTREVTQWAGAAAVKVETYDFLRLSRGEQILWDALDMFARGSGLIDLARCADELDEDNRRALHEATAIAFGLVEAEVA